MIIYITFLGNICANVLTVHIGYVRRSNLIPNLYHQLIIIQAKGIGKPRLKIFLTASPNARVSRK